MHKIIMTVGVVTAAIGVLFAAMIIAQDQTYAAVLTALSIGGGLIVSGALFWCFGAIVDHLIAILATSAQQSHLLAEWMRRASASETLPTASSVAYEPTPTPPMRHPNRVSRWTD